MGAALVVGHGVDLVQDQRMDVLQPSPSALRGQQDVQRLGGGDEDVRRPLGQLLPFRGRGVAGAHRRGDLWYRGSGLLGQGCYLFQWGCQVFLDVVGQGFEGRNVDHLRGVGQLRIHALPHQLIDAGEEGGEGLAGPGGSGDERVPPPGDGRPADGLGFRGSVETAAEPALDDGMERGQSHGRNFNTARRVNIPLACHNRW